MLGSSYELWAGLSLREFYIVIAANTRLLADGASQVNLISRTLHHQLCQCESLTSYPPELPPHSVQLGLDMRATL